MALREEYWDAGQIAIERMAPNQFCLWVERLRCDSLRWSATRSYVLSAMAGMVRRAVLA